MAKDLYHRWLNVPPGQRPPHHYDLLGVPLWTNSPEQIEAATLRQLDKLKAYALHPDAARRRACHQLMDELAQARETLIDEEQRRSYDAHLAPRLTRQASATPPAAADSPAGQPASFAGRTAWVLIGVLAGAIVAGSVAVLLRPVAEPGAAAEAQPHGSGAVEAVAVEPGPVAEAQPGEPVSIEPVPAAPATDDADAIGSGPPGLAHWLGGSVQTAQADLAELARRWAARASESERALREQVARARANIDAAIRQYDATEIRYHTYDVWQQFEITLDEADAAAREGAFIDALAAYQRAAARLATARDRYLEHLLMRGEDEDLPRQERRQAVASLLALDPEHGRGNVLRHRLWNPELRVFPGHHRWLYQATFSPDATQILTGSIDGTARLWDVETGQELQRFDHGSRVRSVAYSPDGRWVLTGASNRRAIVWDVRSGREVRQLQGHSNWVVSIVVLSDNLHVVTGSTDGTARLWDIRTGRELRRYSGGPGQIRAAVSSSEQAVLAGGYDDNTARLWDIQTQEEIRRFMGHEDRVFAVAFSPDDRYVLTGSYDKTARVWDAETEVELLRLDGHDSHVWSVAWTPDGRLLLTGTTDGPIHVWDANTGRELARYEGHTQTVRSLVVSQRGDLVVSGSRDNTARLWDLTLATALLDEDAVE